MFEKNYNLWCSFWNYLPEIREKIKSSASRSGISEDSAIILVLLSDFKDLNLPVNQKFIDELSDKGYVINNEKVIKLTSRGEILSKAFKKQIFGVWIKFDFYT